ncbi:RNA polymerase II subunit A C-terminal domain phosphatase [Rhipicephalus sanguineus]|uniref:RNA polymerase II subunit A C-terminal domain phosphatase n=1 Tax=Rhipicephalus sanguineus TaxID=34632 RepID=UPI0018961C36|nr:RNA polymerase II subunit A C-terminal domain phosphatase [Rhipicephalus sanguineus]
MESVNNSSSVLRHTGRASIKIAKWKIEAGSRISQGTGILLYHKSGAENADAQQQLCKLKSECDGTVDTIVAQEGDVVKPGDVLLKLALCTHPVVMKDLCAECGADLRELGETLPTAADVASVSMIHNVPELRVTQEQARQLGKADEERLRSLRKLVLLVDLDQTLIHTTSNYVPPDMKGVHHFQLCGPQSPWYHTRVRPRTQHFLEQVSQLYELHICTFGARPYAHAIAALLDPDGRYFSHRILSRDECFNPTSKTGNLRALFPCGDSMVCIIDDREDVWNFAPNMVPVKPYLFFDKTGDINAPPCAQPESTFFPTPEDIAGAPRREKPVESNGTTEKSEAAGGDAAVSKGEEGTAEDPAQKEDSPSQSSDPDGSPGSPSETLTEPSGDKDQRPDVAEGAEASAKECEEASTADDVIREKDTEKPKESNGTESNPPSVAPGEPPGGSDQKRDGTEETMDVEAHGSKETADSSEAGQENVASTRSVSGDETPVLSSAPSTDEPVMKHQEELSVTDDATCATESSVATTGNSDGKEDATADESVIREDSVATGSPDAVSDSPPSATPERPGSPDGSLGDKSPEKQRDDDEDSDDYLLYLEEILRTIHCAYYAIYDQMTSEEGGRIPDLKHVVPYVRRKVLKGVHIVFSGVVPMNQPAEKSRAWQVAKSLGATVSRDLCPGVTHLVAARLGTAKVNKARRMPGVHVVHPSWLWCCAERWEHVAEALFPLRPPSRDGASDRRPLQATISQHPKEPVAEVALLHDKQVEQPAESPVYDAVTGKRIWRDRERTAGSGPQAAAAGSSPTLAASEEWTCTASSSKNDHPQLDEKANPYLSMSSEQLLEMDREVEDECSGDDDDDVEQSKENAEKTQDEESSQDSCMLGGTTKNNSETESSAESLSGGECPRGWSKRRRRKRGRECLTEDEEASQPPKFPRSELPEDSDRSNTERSTDEWSNGSVGSVDEEMAAAVEREFLGL